MTTPVNLQELAIERAPRAAGRGVRRRRNFWTRYFAPAVILCGFAGVLGWSLRDSLWPAKAVTVVSVMASRSEMVAADTPLFQAAGWVEPRPQAVVVSALAEGIVEEMLVVEGQAVEAGQVVARLVRRDAEIELDRADADVRLREAELLSARAAMTAAKTLFDEPISLQAALADAEATLTKVETELARLPSHIRAAEARREFSDQEVASKTKSRDSVPAITVQRAKSDLEAALAQLDEYRQQSLSLERERQALAKRRDVLRRQLELKVDETRQVAETQAQVQASEAQVQQARAARDAARLKLERTEVKARTAGHVLALVAKPGSRLMGINQAAAYDASTVVTMYDPQSLQVRADVRLDDVPQVISGQAVRIETPASPTPLTGRVLFATALTDIQKNTLQVKLTIDDPPAVLKPDMLVQVTFLAPPRPNVEGSTLPLRLLAPREVIQGSGSEATVWLADQTSGTARLRRVTVSAAMADGQLEIVTGLNVGDRLIAGGRESLVDGERIRVTGNDPTLGRDSTMNSSTAAGPIKSSHIPRYGANE
ncbi:MAG: efflux RND transporter periplasmic adaptor subunit [Planctomycetaceae bacterium]|nr:efflux RND transporter periplasmic adaptor subunit [Planctomycetaceae bacterium]